MNAGYAVAVLGVLGIIIGGGMWVAGWHHTIGEGGLALGVILLVAGFLLARQKPAQGPPQAEHPSA